MTQHRSPSPEPGMTAKPKRRWYQFSLKAILVVTTLASIPLGWLANDWNAVRKRKAAIATLQQSGAWLDYDQSQPFRPSWLRPRLGQESDGEVWKIRFEIEPDKITDAGLIPVGGLSKLRYLSINQTRVTDAGLRHIAGLTELEWPFLHDTQVSDDGLIFLADHARLKCLGLHRTQISDAGLLHLARLSRLEYLDIRDTHVTEQGIGKLQKALPNLEINRTGYVWPPPNSAP